MLVNDINCLWSIRKILIIRYWAFQGCMPSHPLSWVHMTQPPPIFNSWITGGCWDGHLHSKSWTRQSHAQRFGRTGPDITKGALNAPGQLWTIYRHREHMLAHGLTGLVHSYKSRTIWLHPYGWSMDYLPCIRLIIVWLDCFRVACLLMILTIA